LARVLSACRKTAQHPAFDGLIALLIVVSVVLLVPEIFLPRQDARRLAIGIVQETITAIFALELVIRFGAMPKPSRFLREYWIDLLAVLPVLRPFRIFRFLKLLRLLRLFRLAKLLTGKRSYWAMGLQRYAPERVMLVFFVAFSLSFGALGLAWFESAHAGFGQLYNAFWSALFSLICAEYIDSFPTTTGGKLVVLLLEFAGLSLFALFTGSISALFVEKMKEGGWMGLVSLDELEGHILVCGWNSGTSATLSRLQRHARFRDQAIVVIADRDDLAGLQDLPQPSLVRRIKDDFTRADVLRKANLSQAAVALLFSDVHRGRSRQDADARTVLAALTIEKINPDIHCCAELSNGANEFHLRMGNVDEIVITQDLAGHLLAQAALDSSSARLLRQMLFSEQIVARPVGEELVGQTFRQAVAWLASQEGLVAVGVSRADGQLTLNPAQATLSREDVLLCVQADSP
jgi:voltage-gated potassium channel